jgi:anti-sigma factor RsiW
MTVPPTSRECGAARPRLDAYLDGDLPPAEAARVEGHLAACADCAAELADLRRTVEMVEALPMAEPSAGFTARVLAAVEGLPAPVAARALEPGRPAAIWPAGVALAIAGCLATALVIAIIVGLRDVPAGQHAELLPLLGRMAAKAQVLVVRPLALIGGAVLASLWRTGLALLGWNFALLAAVGLVWRLAQRKAAPIAGALMA